MTAVEWLIEQISFKNSYDERLNIWNKDKDLSDFFDKAKEMERQQAFEFWQGGMKCTEQGGKSFDQYYYENFTNDTKI